MGAVGTKTVQTPLSLSALLDELAKYIQQEFNSRQAELAVLAPKSWLSLSLPLPSAWLAGVSLRGDVQWLAPQGIMALWATGCVQVYHDVAHYRAEQAHWCGWGEAAPLTFFTLSSATEEVSLRLWQPQILLRRDADDYSLTLYARPENKTSTQILDAWRDAVSGLFAEIDVGDAAVSKNHVLSVDISPTNELWLAQVRSSTDAIRAGQFDKVVLARRLQAELAQAVAIPAAMERLRQMYPTCYVVCMPWDKGQVLAATPELLACKRDDELISHALAGTIRREEDVALEALGQAAFFASAKEREEHDLVVASIKRHMQTLCARVEHAAVPALMPLRFVQHLWTRIHGQLCTNIDLLDAVLALHPTPAVLGMPAAAARDWLAHCGEQRDGLYTGVVGWLDTQGDGDAVVVLRAAYLAERKAVLWAGAGIMADSDPVAELAETELKLQTMLEVLGSHR